MTIYRFLLIALSCVVITSNAYAANPDLSKQRVLFQQAKKALETNQITRFEQLKAQLTGYPLQPYLDYLFLQHRLAFVEKRKVIEFLDKNANTFYAERLRNRWLDHLARKKQWANYLAYYQADSNSRRQCHYANALLKTGNQQQAFQQVPKLWLVSKSQDKACDPVFEAFKSKGLLTDDLYWQRIELALTRNQYSLAKYLAKSVKDTSQANSVIALWQRAHNHPADTLKQLPAKTASSKNALTLDNEWSRKIIAHAIDRLARKSTAKAFETWLRIKPAYQFSADQQRSIQKAIAMRSALSRQAESLTYFGDIKNEPWQIRSALWLQDWQAAKTGILSLEQDEQQSNRWQYWLGRAQAELGDKEAATQTYQGLIMERDYYSFLAADKLQQPYQMNDNPIVAEQAEHSAFAQRAEVQRLKEFYTLNMTTESRREAYYQRKNYTERELQLLATFTHDWGWHNQSIALLGAAKYWDALDIRFPVVFDTAILKAGKKQGLDPSWLFGLARQESAFNPHARSHVGARGLMQIMPNTGKLIAKLINKPLKNTSELLIPERNIELGSAYLRKVYDQHQHNPVLATASYNAGPHRVEKWLPPKTLDADIWIENIPFTETRRYARSVLSYAAIFDYQRNQAITPLSQRMPAVNPSSK